ncbi:MAG: proline--tRNA ligase [Desulfarculaceae bacterium]|nr:proline--tRNA ligase [Desulfarculaceae bacterium]MCF8072346.1 proline--tRNA ligase [Desulfarculaceae bacterium]MCF8100267.1 proline--tRNA ligase [Desulfarculaceae bacterium]MCF8116160.1 proline--tRNA ligase [Desulfarculaceae bacterium]
MKFSQAFIPTLKETPAEAEVISHKLMLRAGMIRKLAAGVYTWLPLGLRVLKKVERIVRQEMDAAGALELLMPGVQPADLWQESGRWDHYGRELLRFIDRHEHAYCLAPTHEEVITDLIRREVRSYRDMPLNLYQIQTKFRDEIRPRFGVMRSREFIMKDAYSFDPDEDSSAASYKLMHDAYSAIFTRLGLDFAVVEADSGAIGGSFSHEFMVLADTGEDAIASCSCGWAANFEKAEVVLPEGEEPEPLREVERVDTPDAHTIEQVAALLQVETATLAKTLVYLADGKPVAAMVRGDRTLNEIKLKNLIGAAELELAPAAVIKEVTGGPVGFTGPMGLDIPVYADQELYRSGTLVVGANAPDAHLIGVHMTRDVAGAKRADLRIIEPGDPCPRCGGEPVFARGIEVGHIFRLGTKYSQALGADYLDAEGQSHPVIMGCYGIGITRIVAAAIEQGHDDWGVIFPLAIAPYSVSILPLAGDGEVFDTALKLYDDLTEAGLDVLLDDRDLRPGVKFKDADLIGVPLRVVVGAKGLKQGAVELKRRAGGEVEMVPVGQAAEYVARLANEGGAQPL